MNQKQFDGLVKWMQSECANYFPFYAAAAYKMENVLDPHVNTAQTDGRKIYWSPTFLSTLSQYGALAVFLEELTHCIAGHLWRAPGETANNPALFDLWNLACDQVIHDILDAYADELRQVGITAPWTRPDLNRVVSKEVIISEERLYEILRAAFLSQKSQDGRKTQDGTGGKTESGNSPNTSGEPVSIDKRAEKAKEDAEQVGIEMGQLMSTDLLKRGLPGKFVQIDERDKQALEREWLEILRIGIEAHCEQLGIPGFSPFGFLGMFRNRQDVKLQIPWYVQLIDMLQTRTYDWYKPNKYYEDSGLIVMGEDTIINERPTLAIAIDVSGSISNMLYSAFIKGAQEIVNTTNPRKTYFYTCDACIRTKHEFEGKFTVPEPVLSGGGTDFRPVFMKIAEVESQEHLDLIMYFTDLQGVFPDTPPKAPVYWIAPEYSILPASKNVPFGDVLPINYVC